MIGGILAHAIWENGFSQGVDARTRKVVWNRNDNRVKLICLCTKSSPLEVNVPPSPVTEGSEDGSGAGLKTFTEVTS